MAEARRRTTETAGEASPDAPAALVCTVALCPICTMVTAVGDVRPELAEHLLLAGRELLLALRALIDARLESEEGNAGSPRLERISIE